MNGSVYNLIFDKTLSPKSVNPIPPSRDIAVSEVHADSSWNSRTGDLDVALLKDSIEEIGLMQPIVVTPREKGGYQLVAGFRRFEAVRQLKLPSISAIVVEADLERAKIFNLAENLSRKSLRLYDTMQAVYDLSEKKGIKSAKIARDTGIRQGRVEAMVRVWPRLSPMVKEKWSQIPDASWEPTMHQLTEWSTLSRSEQNRAWLAWASDEDDTSDPFEDGEEAYPKDKKKLRARRKVSVVRTMIDILYEEKTKSSIAQARALQWALGDRSTL
jgi:ParB/RepB/Spo0J family partition protein